MSGASNINDEYILIFRYKTHGSRFELLCRRHEVEKFMTEDNRLLMSVVDDDAVLAKFLQKPTIFFNAKKKEIATQSSLTEAFGGHATVREIILTILTKGEVVETQRDRNITRHSADVVRDQVLQMLPQMLLNPFSGVNPEAFEVKEAINSVLAKWRPSTSVPAVVEAGYVASQIAHKIDCVRIVKKIVFTYEENAPRNFLAHWHDFLIGFTSVVTALDTFTVPAPPPPPQLASSSADDGDGSSAATAAPAPSYHVKEILLVDAMLLVQDPTWERLVHEYAVSLEEMKVSEDETRQFSATLYDPPASVFVFGGSQSADVDKKKHHEGDASETEDRFAKQREAYAAKPSSIEAVVLNRQVGEEIVVMKGNKKGGAGKKNKHADDDGDAYFSDEDGIGGGKGRGKGRGKSKGSNNQATELEEGLDKKTHKELQDLCKKKGMATGGKKSDLIDRLVAFEMNKD